MSMLKEIMHEMLEVVQGGFAAHARRVGEKYHNARMMRDCESALRK